MTAEKNIADRAVSETEVVVAAAVAVDKHVHVPVEHKKAAAAVAAELAKYAAVAVLAAVAVASAVCCHTVGQNSLAVVHTAVAVDCASAVADPNQPLYYSAATAAAERTFAVAAVTVTEGCCHKPVSAYRCDRSSWLCVWLCSGMQGAERERVKIQVTQTAKQGER